MPARIGVSCAAEQSLPELVALAQRVLAGVLDPDRLEILAGTARRLYPDLAVAPLGMPAG